MGGGSNREGLAGAWLPILDNAFCVSGDVCLFVCNHFAFGR
jgi:hypothetical protein